MPSTLLSDCALPTRLTSERMLHALDTLVLVLALMATPVAHLETLVFRTLRLPLTTTFRMFPLEEAVEHIPPQQYSSAPSFHAFSLILVLMTPGILREWNGHMARARSPHARTRKQHAVFRLLQALQVVRVWLAAAYVNMMIARICVALPADGTRADREVCRPHDFVRVFIMSLGFLVIVPNCPEYSTIFPWLLTAV
ncbi:hypothetical protein E4U42_001602 [Claviceps africana]|uniref:Uncharacterized protein n=1 Tax=Claviceps africana TaxID=83212 RepID=A0A8K0NK09_9HYPO|nr:hypothetical protein E4U42_001602 [Claviceps africana]